MPKKIALIRDWTRKGYKFSHSFVSKTLKDSDQASFKTGIYCSKCALEPSGLENRANLASRNKVMARMKTYFPSHGSPMLPLEDIPARAFFSDSSNIAPKNPKAILVMSVHWHTSEPSVNVVSANSTIHDFYGFPSKLSKYNPLGSPDLAKKVELSLSSGFKTINESTSKGLDHGAWIPLFMMYPNVDVPVCQLSLQSRRRMDIHNLRDVDIGATVTAPWAWAFDNWLNDTRQSS
eukprot:Gb_16608 [translate_table: standard]